MSNATVIVLIVLCAYWVLLFYGTHMHLPPDALPGESDKVVHALGYAILGSLLMALRATRGPFPWTSLVARWVVLAVYGAIDEMSQMLVNRTTDLHDWFADILGAAVGITVTGIAFRCYYRKSKAGGLAASTTEPTSC